MAEAAGNDDNSNWGSWGSWISSAKTKSASVFEAVKKDLDELSTVVRKEVSNAGAAIGETLKLDDEESTASTVKKSLSTLFGQVTEALIPSLEDDDVEAVLITNDGTITLTGFQKHLAELQSSDDTYLNAPAVELTENYNRWMEVTEQDQFTQNRLAKHLASSEILNEKYLTLVPDKIPHMEFWTRYLFKRAMLEDALANAELAERKAKSEINSTKPVSPKHASSIIQTEQPKRVSIDEKDEVATESSVKPTKDDGDFGNDDIKWEAEDFGSVEISEEEQERLLREYENEIQEREMKKSLIVPLEEKLKLDESQRNQDKQKNIPKNQQSSSAKQSTKPKTPPTETTAKKQQTANKNNRQSTTKNASKTTTAAAAAATKAKPSEPISLKEETILADKDDTASDESWEKDFDLNDK